MTLNESGGSIRPGPAFVLPMSVTPLLPKGAARKAVDTLGRWIADDVFSPQSAMPTEPELAHSLGVSRATVRDAIKVLSGKGLVRTARRYGTRVLPAEDWNLLDRDVIDWHRADHPRMRRIFAETTELRSVLEPAAAALAADRGTEGQIGIIRDAAYAMHPEAGDIQALFKADCRFHVTILDATGNHVMRQFRQIIVTMLRVSYEVGVAQPENGPVSRQGHIDVAEAIAARNGEEAARRMARMLARNRSLVADYWNGGGKPMCD
jgi:GntR family transcriptional regulator, galactonate operon transcriptional repressor